MQFTPDFFQFTLPVWSGKQYCFYLVCNSCRYIYSYSLNLLGYLVVHLIYWSCSKEPPFSCGASQKIGFSTVRIFSSVESSGHFASCNHPPHPRSITLHDGRCFFRFWLHDWQHHPSNSAPFSSTCTILLLPITRIPDFHFWIGTFHCLYENSWRKYLKNIDN